MARTATGVRFITFIPFFVFPQAAFSLCLYDKTKPSERRNKLAHFLRGREQILTFFDGCRTGSAWNHSSTISSGLDFSVRMARISPEGIWLRRRYSEGVTPSCSRKQREKCCRLEKPHSSAISIMGNDVLHSSRRAFRTRYWTRYSIRLICMRSLKMRCK